MPAALHTYLELSEVAGATHKFYEVLVEDTQVTIRFGRIGTAGQVQIKDFDDAEEALAEAGRKIAEKTRKGYVPASPILWETRHPLGAVIGRLDAWLRMHRPAYYAQLLPGVNDEQWRSFEAALGLSLPDEMREFFRWRNGQALDCYAGLVGNFGLMATATMLEERAALNELLRSGEIEVPNWWSPGWVPFLDDVAGDFYCLDTEGTFTGQAGQIICYWHDYGRRSVIAPDFSSWLSTVVTRLEAGEVGVEEYRVEIADSPDGYPRAFTAK